MSEASSVRPERTWATRVAVVLNLLGAAALFRNAATKGLGMHEYAIERGLPDYGVIVFLMSGVPAALALACAFAMWRCWRRRWLFQLTVGLVPAASLGIHVVSHFVDVTEFARAHLRASVTEPNPTGGGQRP